MKIDHWTRGILAGLLIALAIPIAAASETGDGTHHDTAVETLPTPYTAEQMRQTWVPGLVMVSRIEVGGKTGWMRTEVLSAGAEEVTLFAGPVDAAGKAAGGGGEQTVPWEALRDHALFPSSRAERERHRQETPLGELAGWRYTVQQEDGSTGVFFFADDFPGPPVVFERRLGDQVMMFSEQTERRVE